MALTASTFTAGGEAARLWRNPSVSSGPLLVYCHGVGGSETEFGHADYTALRAWLDTHGWSVVESNAGGAGWGNDAQRAAYRAAVDHVDTLHDVTHIVVFARSMGGIVGSWLHLYDESIAPRSRGLILCSSVQDVMWAYDNNFHATIRTAYGVTNRTDALAATAGRSPIEFPAADYTGARALWQTGDADTIVDPLFNVIANRDRVQAGLALSVTDIDPGGDHYTPRARVDAHTAFLTAVTPPPPIAGGVFRRVARWVLVDGERHAIAQPALG